MIGPLYGIEVPLLRQRVLYRPVGRITFCRIVRIDFLRSQTEKELKKPRELVSSSKKQQE